jgi:hypothetical protein
MNVVPCADHLARLLQVHGVEAETSEDAVWIPGVERWANLWMSQTSTGSWLMEVRATVEGEEVIADRWAALGATQAAAFRDGLGSFCLCGFHVLLASVWGVLETDQVDHEVREVAGEAWDVYLGPYTTRVSGDTPPLLAPRGLVDRVLEVVDGALAHGGTHVVRVYVAVVDGRVTVEALVDDEEHEALREAVATAKWEFPERGFAPLRWLIAARRRVDGPAHQVARECPG